MKKYILRKKISFYVLVIMAVLTYVSPIISRFLTKLDALDVTIFNLERLGLSSSTLQNLYLTVLSIGITCYFTALSMALSKKTSIIDYFEFCGWEKVVLEILILVFQLVWIFCPKNKFISCRDCYIAFSIFCLFVIFAINLISMATIQKEKWMRYKICDSIIKEAKKFKKQCEEKSDNGNLHVYSKNLKNDIISFALKCFEKETPYTLINDCLDELEDYEKENKSLCVDYCYAYIFFIRGDLIFKEKDHKPDDDEFKLFERCLLRSAVGRFGNYDFDYMLGKYLDIYENLVKEHCLHKSHILAIKEALLFYNMKHKTEVAEGAETETNFQLTIETCKRIIVFSVCYVEKREFERLLEHFCFLMQLNVLNGNSEQNRKVFDKSIVDLAIWIYNLSVTKEIDGNEYAVYISELLKHASEIVMNDFDTDFYHEVLPETDVNVQKYTRNFYISAILLHIWSVSETIYRGINYFESFFGKVKYCNSQNANKGYDIILQSLNEMTEMDFLKTSSMRTNNFFEDGEKLIKYIKAKKGSSQNNDDKPDSQLRDNLKKQIERSFENLKQQEQEKHDVSELYSFLLKKYVPCKCEDSVDYYDVCLPYLVDKLPYLPNKELISIKSISDLIEREELINGSILLVPKQYKNYLDTHEIEGVSDYERGVSDYKRGVLSNGKKKLFVEYIDCKSNYIVSKEKFESVVCYRISDDDEEKLSDCVALRISFEADNSISLPLYKIED